MRESTEGGGVGGWGKRDRRGPSALSNPTLRVLYPQFPSTNHLHSDLVTTQWWKTNLQLWVWQRRRQGEPRSELCKCSRPCLRPPPPQCSRSPGVWRRGTRLPPLRCRFSPSWPSLRHSWYSACSRPLRWLLRSSCAPLGLAEGLRKERHALHPNSRHWSRLVMAWFYISLLFYQAQIRGVFRRALWIITDQRTTWKNGRAIWGLGPVTLQIYSGQLVFRWTACRHRGFARAPQDKSQASEKCNRHGVTRTNFQNGATFLPSQSLLRHDWRLLFWKQDQKT